MTEEAKELTEEDSMEDILHSIRDIIAEETTEGEEVLELTEIAEEPAEKAEEEGANDVLEDIDDALSEEPAIEEPDAPAEEPAPEESSAEKPTPKETIPAAEPATSNLINGETLVEEATANASAAAMKELVNNIPGPKIEHRPVHGRGVDSVEDLVLEALRPMLKNWLDGNLESIVREIVEREIKKLLPHE